uniref:Uncharacterized protein n=1 Tax=Arundo donax TaxID=35708 RepID=A0A0A9EIF2_ARUDO
MLSTSNSAAVENSRSITKLRNHVDLSSS